MFATEVAVTVTTAGFGTVAGAVYNPVLLTVPAVAVQVTFVFFVPATVAVNCAEADVMTFALVGESVTTTGFVVVELVSPLPPQPAISPITSRHAKASLRWLQISGIRTVAFLPVTKGLSRWNS